MGRNSVDVKYIVDPVWMVDSLRPRPSSQPLTLSKTVFEARNSRFTGGPSARLDRHSGR
jgi:hypothetical protein